MKTRTPKNQKHKTHLKIQSLKQKKRIPKKKSHVQQQQRKAHKEHCRNLGNMKGLFDK
jgi:hypothetical protein